MSAPRQSKKKTFRHYGPRPSTKPVVPDHQSPFDLPFPPRFNVPPPYPEHFLWSAQLPAFRLPPGQQWNGPFSQPSCLPIDGHFSRSDFPTIMPAAFQAPVEFRALDSSPLAPPLQHFDPYLEQEAIAYQPGYPAPFGHQPPLLPPPPPPPQLFHPFEWQLQFPYPSHATNIASGPEYSSVQRVQGNFDPTNPSSRGLCTTETITPGAQNHVQIQANLEPHSPRSDFVHGPTTSHPCMIPQNQTNRTNRTNRTPNDVGQMQALQYRIVELESEIRKLTSSMQRNYRTGHPNAKISNKKHKHHRPASEHNDTHKSQRAHQAGKGWRESKVIHGLDVETTSIKMFDEGAELEAGCAGPGREGRGREQTRVKLPGVFEVGEERESTAEVQHLGEDGNGKSI